MDPISAFFKPRSSTNGPKKRQGEQELPTPAAKKLPRPPVFVVQNPTTGAVKKPRPKKLVQLQPLSTEPSYLALYRTLEQLEAAGIPTTTAEIVQAVVSDYRAFSNRPPPPMSGVMENPVPIPKTLIGFVFILTGVLESMERTEAVDYIKACGGQVSTTVAKKTTHAIVGTNCGASKLQQINDMSLPKINQSGLTALVICIAAAHLPAPQVQSTRVESDEEFAIDSD